jgi:hypothetical protein
MRIKETSFITINSLNNNTKVNGGKECDDVIRCDDVIGRIEY